MTKWLSNKGLELKLEKNIEVKFKKKNGKYKWDIQYMGESIDSFETNFHLFLAVIKKEFIESVLFEGDDKFTNEICNKINIIEAKKNKE